MKARKIILQTWLLLAREGIRAIEEEDWRAWEETAGKKLALGKRMEHLSQGAWQRDEREILREVKVLEEKAQRELLKKREDTRREIEEVLLAGAGVKGYRQNRPVSPRRRLGIKG